MELHIGFVIKDSEAGFLLADFPGNPFRKFVKPIGSQPGFYVDPGCEQGNDQDNQA